MHYSIPMLSLVTVASALVSAAPLGGSNSKTVPSGNISIPDKGHYSYDHQGAHQERPDNSIVDGDSVCDWVIPIPIPPSVPNDDRFLADLDTAGVSSTVQQGLGWLMPKYEGSVFERERVRGGPRDGVNETALQHFEQMKNPRLYAGFSIKFIQAVLALQKQVMKDLRALNITREFLTKLEMSGGGNWTFPPDATGFALSLQANQVIAGLTEILIDEINQVDKIRDILADAVIREPHLSDGTNVTKVKMDPDSEWLVDYMDGTESLFLS